MDTISVLRLSGNRGCGLRSGSALMPGDQYVDIAADFLSGGDRVKKRRLDGGVVVFRDNQN